MTEQLDFTINELQEMIDAEFGSDVPKLVRIRDELRQTSRLGVEDLGFYIRTTQQWVNRHR